MVLKMTVENFVRIVWSFCENKKSRKWLFFDHYWAIFSCFSNSSHTILMPLRMQGPLWVCNDCAKFYENRMDRF